MDNNSISPTNDIPLNCIVPNPYQPRQLFDPIALLQLADSIVQNGILQPILVRRHMQNNDCFEIISGERRFRAAEIAKLTHIPAICRPANDSEMLQWAITENELRESLNPIDVANAYHRLIHEFDLTTEEIARQQTINEKTVINYIRLLKLDEQIILLVKQNKLSFAHARLLAGQPQSIQQKLGTMAAKLHWSSRKLENHLKLSQQQSLNTRQNNSSSATQSKDVDVLSLENNLCQSVGLKTTIDYQKSGKGRVSFNFSNFDELEGLLDKLLPYREKY